MNVPTTRRGILIGSLSSAAFPLVASAHDPLESQSALAPTFNSTVAHQSGFSVPIDQLTWLDVKIDTYDENGFGRTGTGYVYHFFDAERASSTVIAAEQDMLRDAKKVFLTFSQRDTDGGPNRVQQTRMEVANKPARPVRPVGAHSKLAVVAQANWQLHGDTWHLRVA